MLPVSSSKNCWAPPPRHTPTPIPHPPVQDLGSSAPLEALAATVPHGFMRGKLFEMLADQAVALPRAVWFVQVAYLNRTK